MRRVIITVLTLAAAAVCAIWLAGVILVPMRWHYAGQRLRVRCDGPNDLFAVFRISGIRQLTASKRRGTIRFTVQTPLDPPRVVRQEWAFGQFGVARYNPSWPKRRSVTAVYAPAWAIFVVLGAYPAIAFIRGHGLRYARALRGQCVECGYSLRGLQTATGSDYGTERAEYLKGKLARAKRRFPIWCIRGMLFGGLAPLAHLCLQVYSPENDFVHSGFLLGLIVLPAAHFGFVGLLPLYLANVLIYGCVAGCCAFACIAFTRLRFPRGHASDTTEPRCPECGTEIR